MGSRGQLQVSSPLSATEQLPQETKDDTEVGAIDASEKQPLMGPIHLPIYGPTLAANEFRLACVSAAAKDEDKIVHVSLEVYSQTDCPEYETVSYTWGGENGDYTLCRPIFVGLY